MPRDSRMSHNFPHIKHLGIIPIILLGLTWQFIIIPDLRESVHLESINIVPLITTWSALIRISSIEFHQARFSNKKYSNSLNSDWFPGLDIRYWQLRGSTCQCTHAHIVPMYQKCLDWGTESAWKERATLGKANIFYSYHSLRPQWNMSAYDYLVRIWILYIYISSNSWEPHLFEFSIYLNKNEVLIIKKVM
jgi:hypothetical protein